MEGRQRFGPSTLVVALNRLAEEQAQRNRAPGDWLEELTRELQLTDEQQGELKALSDDRAPQEGLEGQLREVAASDGRSRFVVAHVPSRSAPGGVVHELRRETLAADAAAAAVGTPPVETSAIAHCDADCGNWGWG